MKTILKFNLDTIDRQTLLMPEAAEILTIQTQDCKPCLWVRVNSNAKLISRNFVIHGTGHKLPDTTGDYIGTYQMEYGSLVFHVFEEI